MSQSLAVIEALVAEGIRKHLTANRKYLSANERQSLAVDSAAVAIAVLIDITDVHTHIANGQALRKGRYRVVTPDPDTFNLIPVKDQP